MNDEDFDIQEFARLFDAALASNNPSVKKALRNFMLVAGIVEAENTEENSPGPFGRLLNTLNALEARLYKLEKEMSNQSYANQMAREMSRGTRWEDYTTTTTWPTYHGISTSYKKNDVTSEEVDYLSKLLSKGKI